MNRRLLILLIIAFGAAGSTVFSLRGWIEGQRADYANQAQQTQPAVDTKEVLVANDSMPAGLLVKLSHLRWQAWPKDAIAESYIVRGRGIEMTDFEGTVVRVGVASGEPVTNERVVKSGERGFLAAVLTPGMRAFSVPVTATTGIAGFIFPGDRVDLIVTHVIDKKGDNERTRRASETVLTDIRVLAVDQQTDDQNGKAAIAKTVTLELTPKQAEIVSVSLVMEQGRLSLSLRSLTKEDDPDFIEPKARTHTLDTQASRLLDRRNRQARKATRVRVVKGGETVVLDF
jgi:pilus assembly protein CpaB